MGFDDGCDNTGLVLGLGFSTATSTCASKPNSTPKIIKHAVSLKFEEIEPSLTLGLSGGGDYHHQIGTTRKVNNNRNILEESSNGNHVYHQTSSPHSTSAVSSFSVKRERERDLSSEETGRERFSSRVSDEDELLDASNNARKKLRLNKQQAALLEESFKQHSTLNPKQKQALARQLNLRPRQVEVWFQNRRARTKLKQTEVDCELLKKCCETLTDENRKLQKELQELKALKQLAQPFYMHMPAATLTICPSCERLGGADHGGANKPPETRFYNPFANPSAAC